MAVRVLTGIAKSSPSDPARVSAANILLERGWGKAQQDVNIGGDIKLTIRKMLDDDDVIDMIDVTPAPKLIDQE